MSKVLLVEDDNNLREIYEARLAAEGYDIITAQNGEEALVVAKQNKPDLIISDVMMPRISGFEMLDILRNTDELRDTKVIMLTALGQAEDQVRAGKLGADKYLVKSQVTLEDIVNTAKELLGELTPAAATPDASAEQAPAAEVPATAGPVAIEQPVVAPAPLPPEEPELIPTPPPTPPIDTSPSIAASPQSIAATQMAAPTFEPTPATASVPVVDPDPIVPVVQQPIATTAPASIPEPVVAQTTAAEEATVDSQIETFANTTAELQVPMTAPVDAPEETPVVAPVSISAANDKVLTTAMDDLVEATAAPAEAAIPPSQKEVPTAPSADPVVQMQPVFEPSPAVIAPTPETPEVVATEPNNELQAVAGKKVIQPINDLSSPGQNLDALLAQEEAKEQIGGTVSPVVNGVPAATAPAPGLSTDPNSIAL